MNREQAEAKAAELLEVDVISHTADALLEIHRTALEEAAQAVSETEVVRCGGFYTAEDDGAATLAAAEAAIRRLMDAGEQQAPLPADEPECYCGYCAVPTEIGGDWCPKHDAGDRNA